MRDSTAHGAIERLTSERDAAQSNLRDAYAEIDISHREEAELRERCDEFRRRLANVSVAAVDVLSEFGGCETTWSQSRALDALAAAAGLPAVPTERHDYRSERDYLRERLRELAEEIRGRAAIADAARDSVRGAAARFDLIGQHDAFLTAAEAIERIVTEAETGGNETATREVHDGTPESTT